MFVLYFVAVEPDWVLQATILKHENHKIKYIIIFH